MKIRAYNGSLSDARAIVEIDRATFANCPYSAEQIVALEADAGQYAWVAEAEAGIVGYVAAFVTQSLAGGRWEVDELAVHPEAQGQGIGTALVSRAIEVGAQQSGLCEARALVAADNLASQRVFSKNGFRVVDRVDLLAYRVNGRIPRPPRPGVPAARPARASECAVLATLLEGKDCETVRMAHQLDRRDVQYLVAGDALGAAELIHVRTLQYEGLWIEALAVAQGGAAGNRIALALFGAAIEEAKRQEGIDLVGYLASPRDRQLYSAAVAEGMALLDRYKTFVYEW